MALSVLSRGVDWLFSMLPMEVAEIPVRSARSDWLQLRMPRAPRICAVVILMVLSFFQSSGWLFDALFTVVMPGSANKKRKGDENFFHKKS